MAGQLLAGRRQGVENEGKQLLDAQRLALAVRLRDLGSADALRRACTASWTNASDPR
jgi:hypothetical protein